MSSNTCDRYLTNRHYRCKRMLNFFAFACVGMAVVQASADAGSYYCTPAGAGAHNGTSAANAWSLSEAISRAVAGDVVLLQSGSYGHFNYTRSNADWITWRENIGQTAVFADG